MPKVLNARYKMHEPGVLIDRSTKWGNPFRIGLHGDRAEVVRKHREWFLAQEDLVEEAKHELRGKNLICWCAPQACHGDTLLEVANT